MKVRIKNISHVIMGQSLQENEMFDIETEDSFEFHQGNKLFNSKDDIGKSRVFGLAGKIAIEKDILFSVRAPVGDIAILNRKIIIGRGLAAIRAGKKVNINYLYYVLNHSIEKLKESQTGTTFDSITTSELKNLIIEIHNLEQQTVIANFLDIETLKIDKKVELLSQKYEKLEEYKQSVIFETVTKGLDGSVQMKDSGVEWIGDIPAHWEVKRVKDCFNIGRGRVIAVSEVEKEKTENNKYPVYSAATENNGVIGYINTFDFNQPLLTWTTDGAKAGTVFIRDGKFNCTNVCGTLISKNNERKLKFYKYALEVQTPYYKRADINGAKIMNNEMANIFIFQPSSVKEEDDVIEHLDNISHKVNLQKKNIKKQIELLKEYKQSVIYEYVTGKEVL